MSASARADSLGAVEEEIGLLLHRTRRALGARGHDVHPELQGASYLLLAWLAQHGPVRASAMVEAIGTDKGSLSRQLHHLEELGLVERGPDPDDRRASLVSVAGDARRRLAAVDDEHRRQVCERLSGWTETDLDDLAARLAAYNRALD